MQLCKADWTHSTTSTHLGPKFTAPRPLRCRNSNFSPNWCQRPCCLTSRLWLRPDDHEMHSEQSNFDACWKKHKFQCMDLKVLGLKRGCFHPTFLVMHYTAPNQNKCKILPQQIPNHPHLAFHSLFYWSSKLHACANQCHPESSMLRAATAE